MSGQHAFAIPLATFVIATSLVFWLVLGVLTGAFFKRYANDAGAAA